MRGAIAMALGVTAVALLYRIDRYLRVADRRGEYSARLLSRMAEGGAVALATAEEGVPITAEVADD